MKLNRVKMVVQKIEYFSRKIINFIDMYIFLTIFNNRNNVIIEYQKII